MQTVLIMLKCVVVVDHNRSVDMFGPPAEADGKDPGSAVVNVLLLLLSLSCSASGEHEPTKSQTS